MLTMREKQSLVLQVAKRYRQSSKLEKTQILEEFIKNTGYNRSYARRVLRNTRHQPGLHLRKKVKRHRSPTYDPTLILRPLTKLWDISNFLCGKRLAPLIPDYLVVLRRDHVWEYPLSIDEQLLADLGEAYKRSSISQIKVLLGSIFPSGLAWSQNGTLNREISPLYQSICTFDNGAISSCAAERS